MVAQLSMLLSRKGPFRTADSPRGIIDICEANCESLHFSIEELLKPENNLIQRCISEATICVQQLERVTATVGVPQAVEVLSELYEAINSNYAVWLAHNLK